jgi:hypothetical protein
MPSVRSIVRALIPAFALFVLVAAAAQASSVREVGEYKDSPLPSSGFKPGCAPPAPATATCQAIGHVTGFQTQIGTHKNPYVVHRSGKIVAFTIKLGKPDNAQTQFFGTMFGTSPSARITILKRPKSDKRGGNPMRVLAQSEIFILTKYLGGTPTFAFAKPLAIPAGATVALTVPTWAPSFAINRSADETWRSSRPKNDCGGTGQAALGKVGRVGNFDCFYRTARLLYTATFVPDPKPTN